MVKSICARSCECRTIPSILITVSHIVCGVFVLTDIEVESVSAGASIIVCIVVGVSAALIVDGIMPSKLHASILMEGVVSTAIDREVEGVNIGAG